MITEIQGIKLISIPDGRFRMGANYDSDEHPIHKVTVSSFEMSIFSITQGNYKSIIGANPSHFKGNDNLPVEQVTWWDAVKYCIALSVKAGLQPCYNETTGYCDFTKSGFRLPSEAEWEYACRAGTTTAYNLGNFESDLSSAGWYSSNSFLSTHSVGGKIPNAWGIYDMHGNLWEWCNDWFGDYSSGNATNPMGAKYGAYRILRGGSWSTLPYYCRSTYRDYSTPTMKDKYIGFRVVRRP